MNWRVKFRLFQASTFGIVFTAIILMAILTGKYIETVGFFVAFVALRNTFGKTYHSQSFWNCILISCIMFIAVITFMPRKNTTILAYIALGLIVDFVAYKYNDYIDIKVTSIKTFNVDNCSESELIERCQEIHLSQENINLAVEFFIKKTRQCEIAKSLCIDEKSVQMRKRRLKQKINKK